MYWARIDENNNRQSLEDHIKGVKRRCGEKAFPDLGATLSLISLLHDMGKFSDQWQAYLLDNDRAIGRKIPHSPHGANYFRQHCGTTIKTAGQLFAIELIDFVIRAHHGMFDLLNNTGENALEVRYANFEASDKETYLSAVQNSRTFIESELNSGLVQQAISELEALYLKTLSSGKLNQNDAFTQGIVARMILSALIDADWTDAASFSGLEEETSKIMFAENPWSVMQQNLFARIKGFKSDTKLNLLRQRISDQCFENGKLPSGIYRLEVPTGGGKTLAVMNFGLEHALQNAKDRIIYVAPYKTIIDQTAKEYRRSLLYGVKDLDNLYVIEHHGDVVQLSDDLEHNKMQDYLSESWSAPIIVTTMVQLLNSFFSDNKASLRRFNKLNNAILIIDEFQTMPVVGLEPVNLTLNTLARLFNLTVVLCTATQPPLDEYLGSLEQGIISPLDYAEQNHLVEDYSSEEAFNRVAIIDNCRQAKPFSEAEVADFVKQQTLSHRSTAVILNTRKAAKRLYQLMREDPEVPSPLLLSNDMVPVHRMDTIEKIRKKLEQDDENILLISTSLIEAGVDLSFQCIIRSVCGLDSIIQAAGRCNRHGEMANGHVMLINPDQEFEDISRMYEVKVAQEITLSILNDIKIRPEVYDHSLSSPKAIKHYFKKFYRTLAACSHYPCHNRVETPEDNKGKNRCEDCRSRKTSLVELLSLNTINRERYRDLHHEWPRHVLHQAFKTAGQNYLPIESDAIRLLVPWHDGKKLINDLASEVELKKQKKLLREAEKYSVPVFLPMLKKLEEEGGVYKIANDSIRVLREEFYSEETGLTLEETGFASLIQ